MGILDDSAAAISSIESAGSGGYSALGPATKGDRAFGRYQIMGSNIGPWSREVLGREVTQDEFMRRPEIQDAIFKGKFGQYIQKYGPEGAAKAWFAGEKGMKNPNARDALGTSVSQYAAKFNRALGQPSSGTPLRVEVGRGGGVTAVPAPPAPSGLLAAPSEEKSEGGMNALLAGLLTSPPSTPEAQPMKLAPMPRGQSPFPDLPKYLVEYLKSAGVA